MLALSLLLGGIIFLTILPTFVDMFTQMSTALPFPTMILMAVTQVARKPAAWVVLIGSSLLVTHSLDWAWKNDEKRPIVFAALLRIPVVGRMLFFGSLSRYCWILETLMSSGVEMVASLKLAAAGCGNPLIQGDVARLSSCVVNGEPLSAAYRTRVDVYHSLLYRFSSVGEEANSLADSFGQLAGWFDQELESTVDKLNALLEPLLMCGLAVTVGGMVIAIFLPLYGSIGSLSN